ncbi:MAG TPA: tRNA 2-thiouridine(34) synthase MnmA [Bacteroidales bacterium]|nr:tRNA 2-thiouridine(34) synthase MnmA [Bacteroidales bacterium]
MPKKERVLLAMSGGVDSSVAAILLQEQGYELVGVTMKVWDYESAGGIVTESGCCNLDAINDARKVAVDLGFPHFVLDLRKEFEEKIISNFISEYLAARTPNPCVLCNKLMKWEDLLQKADELDCRYIATGHYARIGFENDRYFLRKGLDDTKDQTYVLWGLSQRHLSRTIFPLGSYDKKDIKILAAKHGLSRIAEKSESYEICFIPDNDYRGFLKRRIEGLEAKVEGGDFLDKDGKILGKHHGYPFYTIGQRKGLEVAVGHPLYVKAISAEKNTVVLTERENLMTTELYAYQINLMKYPELSEMKNIISRIRYKDKGMLSAVKIQDSMAHVVFENPVAAVTPGQSVVFYEGDDVIGGGIIK